MPSCCRGGRTRPRCGTASSWSTAGPTSWVVDDRTRLDEDLGDVTDVIEANLDTRPVYLIRQPAEIEALSQRYLIERVGTPGNLFRVVGRMETT